MDEHTINSICEQCSKLRTLELIGFEYLTELCFDPKGVDKGTNNHNEQNNNNNKNDKNEENNSNSIEKTLVCTQLEVLNLLGCKRINDRSLIRFTR